MPAIGLIILAAGASARMGEPKQLLTHAGKSLINRALEVGLQSRCTHHVLVLGANAQSMRSHIGHTAIPIVENQMWATGLASSVSTGLKTIVDQNKELDAAVFMTCDQPFVMSRTINDLIDSFIRTYSPIVACRYSSTIGVPALFAKQLFPELFALQGDVGASAIIKKYAGNVMALDVPEAAVDIDTPDDYNELSVTS
ncbi:MAG TPA: nucleotidyltransferase family protein [Candidatus Obscuribacterales bacterium]